MGQPLSARSKLCLEGLTVRDSSGGASRIVVLWEGGSSDLFPETRFFSGTIKQTFRAGSRLGAGCDACQHSGERGA